MSDGIRGGIAVSRKNRSLQWDAVSRKAHGEPGNTAEPGLVSFHIDRRSRIVHDEEAVEGLALPDSCRIEDERNRESEARLCRHSARRQRQEGGRKAERSEVPDHLGIEALGR